MPQLCEALTLTALFFGWYFSIYVMYNTRAASGKRRRFVGIVCAGHVINACKKLTDWSELGILEFLVILYPCQFLVTMVDAWLIQTLNSGRSPFWNCRRIDHVADRSAG